jgi:pimeloyl-ACP methyl ester carboxylesterase
VGVDAEASGGVGRLMFAAFLLAACVKPPMPTMTPEAVLPVRTADGWELSLRHHGGNGPPVLLVHGMSANHYNWDYRDDISLASYLRARGWDVWVPELRGDPGSVAPSLSAARNYSFDDHARYDLPAIVDTVLAATHTNRLYWVGHSMGGLLLYTALAQYPGKIVAGVAIGSPVTFTHLPPLTLRIRRDAWLVAGRGRLPSRAIGAVSGTLGRNSFVMKILANTANFDGPTIRALSARAMVDLPRAMARQALLWLNSGQLTTVDGRAWLTPANVPVLAMGGTVDRIAPWEDVRTACDVLPDCRFRLMGVEGGFSVDYGHVDPVLGKTAATEIYPVVEDFLEAHR